MVTALSIHKMTRQVLVCLIFFWHYILCTVLTLCNCSKAVHLCVCTRMAQIIATYVETCNPECIDKKRTLITQRKPGQSVWPSLLVRRTNAYIAVRVCNTPGNPGNLLELFFLLEILEILKFAKFPGNFLAEFVCFFVIVTHNSGISKCFSSNIWQ